mmetsp:Transcript_14317/g.21057  ORF Transcript_14317/g.21057 Transcript_14317/m.21057 type:complete len:141 (-) Transcript_14317:150-572(-)|eukprot:CAMPEP_0113944196 /NCGR_PEP_ID=MMETSP1339-20121228/31172_1 /TAXON_ID=94617 /ORGANISM="Fibrocapsa japonica" /LENGTH=140 /DNA_ID=CAMNT_0000949291 /DNA_START=93 /DNA_END=515 /DNA_ORIENTATION=+ /assembly_acc=CAM_ASM_000762
MVRIINGEIVQDDDPRLRNRSQGGSSGHRGVRGVSGLHSNRVQSGGYGGGTYGSQNPPPQAVQQGANPLDLVAEKLGIQGKTFTIPALFGMPSTQVELIYLILAGLIILIFGLRGLVGVVLIYFLVKHSNDRQQRQQAQR